MRELKQPKSLFKEGKKSPQKKCYLEQNEKLHNRKCVYFIIQNKGGFELFLIFKLEFKKGWLYLFSHKQIDRINTSLFLKG